MGLTVDPAVLNAFGYAAADVDITQIGSGLINRTYLLYKISTEEKYILQNINTAVFKNPETIATNIKAVAGYLKKEHPDYFFIKPVPTIHGDEMASFQDEYWRLLPYVDHSVSLDVLSRPEQAYEAARQFGKLSGLLNHFKADTLEPTIPGFHDLNLRFDQFNSALTQAPEALREKANAQIKDALKHRYLLDYFNTFLQSPDFPDRVMHHDTKISNVLLDAETFKGICVIDLDTIMPGKFISDLGDMMRTYLCAFSENEIDLSKIKIRLNYFEAMIKGYLSEMKNILTVTEKNMILFSGKYIIYMQALRFLTDFLNGNVYYPTAYAEQNLDRAKNQFKLLQEISAHEKVLQDIIDTHLI